MSGKATQMYRVKAVAQRYDVSVQTIHRAIKSGQLRALKLGSGKGTLRIPADALVEYEKSCGLTPADHAAIDDDSQGVV